ncbi:MAG: winged helix-turn-helix domain-containing protein [Verrucomicrobiae bacterium]|nr:winged helix-turn-helix domain-containing protein [Verrucomicrobiae bacterium]
MDTNFCVQPANRVPLQLAGFLRDQIQSGKLKPGERLPTTNELVQLWNVGRVSVHRALTRLAAEGMIERKRHEGTFVRNDVNKGVIGVLIGANLADETIHSQHAIIQAIHSKISGTRDCHWDCRVYGGLIAGGEPADVRHSTACRAIRRDMESYAFKGLIQIVGDLTSKQIAQLDFDLPIIRLGPSLSNTDMDVALDRYQFGESSVKFAAGQGRKKLAYLRACMQRKGYLPDLEGVRQTAASLQLPSVSVHQITPEARGGAWLERAAYAKTIQLIDQWKKNGDWPEALLIPDDIATRGVALALAHKGVSESNRPMVIIMANEGIYHHYGIPVVRCEFSLDQVAGTLLELLRKKMTNAPLPQLPVKVPPTGRFVETVDGCLVRPLTKPHLN